MTAIYVATKNLHKVTEFQKLLPPEWECAVRPLPEGIGDSPENGSTFESNAMEKAVFYSRFVDSWVLADDSGLCVPILNGEPGVLSARYAGAHGDDVANMRRLLDKLEGVPDESRNAYFVCAIALWHPRKRVGFAVRGELHGRIGHEPRGGNGFGYDPVFLVPELNKTLAELDPSVKNQISHRADAIRVLERLVGGELHALLHCE